jgi:hypothetical protein
MMTLMTYIRDAIIIVIHSLHNEPQGKMNSVAACEFECVSVQVVENNI